MKDTLGSAKPEIVQKILTVLKNQCFESAADLAEFSEGSAELAKLGSLADTMFDLCLHGQTNLFGLQIRLHAV